MSRSVLVTGATGQLGAALTRALLDQDRHVRALVRNPDKLGALATLHGAPPATGRLELCPGDVTAPATVLAAAKGCETAFHLAGLVSYLPRDLARMVEVNVNGTGHVLDACARAGVRRLVLTSSIAALGHLPPGETGDEDTAWNWGSDRIPYMDTKHAAEGLVLGEQRLETVAVNPGIVLGAGDLHQNGGRLLLQLHRGQVFGWPPGATTVATLDAVIQGHLGAMARGRSGERYILGGDALSFKELFERLADVIGARPPQRAVPAWVLMAFSGLQHIGASITGKPARLTPPLAKVSCRNRRFSSAKAIAELDYRPEPLERGAQACWDWYRARDMV